MLTLSFIHLLFVIKTQMEMGGMSTFAVSFSVLQFGSQRKILLPFPFAGIIGGKKSTEIQINLICYPLSQTP